MTYTIEELEEFMNNGSVPCICTECKNEWNLEPDADEGWCEECDKLVKVKNPLIEMGAM